MSTPLAISTHTTFKALPDEVRPALPSIDELIEIVRDAKHDRNEHG